MAKLYANLDEYVSPERSDKKLYADLNGGKNEINGAAYLGGKVAAGAASIGIGAYNLVAGAWDQLTGNTYRAEKRYAENESNGINSPCFRVAIMAENLL